MAIGVMEVTLVDCRGLPNTEIFGGIDPYVLIQYKGQERKSSIARGFSNVTGEGGPFSVQANESDVTMVLKTYTSSYGGKGGNPVWNEKFTFRVEYPGSGEQYKLVLKIMDHDTFSSDDYIGESTIYVKELLEQGVAEGTAELHPLKYRVVDSNKSYRGEIRVGITITAKVQGTTETHAFGGWKESGY